ncbi:hypothetical protein ACTXJU_18525, partial [Glutamicibacter ardleyensis]|uniref:hypothetical protein n=1 Tax=Glutamicibacter ardleyensis TaxID=225894 RepID=UPI003FD494C5
NLHWFILGLLVVITKLKPGLGRSCFHGVILSNLVFLPMKEAALRSRLNEVSWLVFTQTRLMADVSVSSVNY